MQEPQKMALPQESYILLCKTLCAEALSGKYPDEEILRIARLYDLILKADRVVLHFNRANHDESKDDQEIAE